MKNIIVGVIAGGYSSEYEVSLNSADTLLTNIPNTYIKYLVIITKEKWVVSIDNEEYPIDKNDFSFTYQNKKITFDFAYITIHGTPGEDGKLQGYFDMLDIPYSTCSQKASALTFNKWATNKVLKEHGISCANSIILRQHNSVVNTKHIVDELGLPLFVKPNDGGSSFGISKVKEESNIQDAIKNAFKEGKEVVLESNINGTEVTCGAYISKGTVYTLPLTEIVSHNDYFDFEAKYKGLSDEITPARISKELTNKIQELTINIYHLLGLSGIIRIDYMLDDITPYVIEVNTTPGMSKASLIPQQVAYQDNIDLPSLLNQCIQDKLTT